jgi:hypothetical protein
VPAAKSERTHVRAWTAAGAGDRCRPKTADGVVGPFDSCAFGHHATVASCSVGGQTPYLGSRTRIPRATSADATRWRYKSRLVWTSANVTFLAAEKIDGTYISVYGPTGTEAMVTVGTAARTILETAAIADLGGLRYLKLRSGTEASPVNQAADRVVNMLVRQGIEQDDPARRSESESDLIHCLSVPDDRVNPKYSCTVVKVQ